MAENPIGQDPGGIQEYFQISYAVVTIISGATVYFLGWLKRLMVELYVIKRGGKTREGQEAPKVVYTHAFETYCKDTDRRIHELDKRLSDASARQDVRIDALFNARKNE